MKKKQLSPVLLSLLLVFSSVSSSLVIPAEVQAARAIIFPIIGSATFSNDFNAPRGNGPHHATDIFASKHRKLVSTVDGTVTFVGYPQPSWGYAIFIRDDQGYTYRYLHINNDTPGTDDGKGGGMNAYATDMKVGNRVLKGQHIGYVGDSGNAENTPPHLHLEMYDPRGDVINPYNSLVQAQRISSPKPYPQLANELLPYKLFDGGVSIAMGNLDVDASSEFVTGAGKGGGPQVKLYDSNNASLGGSFFAYDSTFRGGIDVAVGDVDGDGVNEIVTGPGPGGGSEVRVFEKNGSLAGSFLAHPATFNDGLNVSVGDVDGDGTDEIITGPQAGSGPYVKVQKLDGTQVGAFFAYEQAFRGGIDVTIGDVDGDGNTEIVTSPGPRGGPHIKTFALNGTMETSFFAYDSAFRGGVRVSAGNVRLNTAADEILTVPATVGGPHTRMFTSTGSVISQMYFIEEWWRNGTYDVAAGFDTSKTAAGTNRRVTVRAGLE